MRVLMRAVTLHLDRVPGDAVHLAGDAGKTCLDELLQVSVERGRIVVIVPDCSDDLGV
jgi:hypothetical protein